MSKALIGKLGLDLKAVLTLSEKAGRVGSWLYIRNTKEIFWTDGLYPIFHIASGTKITLKQYIEILYPPDIQAAKAAFQQIFTHRVYQSTYRVIVQGKIRWIEERGQLYHDENSGYDYVIGMTRDVTQVKTRQTLMETRKQNFDIITDYLGETTNSTDLYSIVGSAKKTIRKVMDVVFIGIFVLEHGDFIKVITSGTKCPDYFLAQSKEDFISYKTIQHNKEYYLDIQDYPNAASKKALMELGAQAILSIPIRDGDKTIAALSMILKEKQPSLYELEFCHTICGYLSVQIKNALLYRRVQKELEEKNREKQRNLELQKSIELQKLKTEFFANISHEFKTPLNIIQSSLELMRIKMKQAQPDLYEREYKKLCNYIEQNAYRLLHLSTNVLDSTRIDSNFMDIHFAKWDIREVLAEIINSVECYAQTKNISLSFEPTFHGPCEIVCDRMKIERIIMNLISNSIKNTREGGHIMIELSDSMNFISISVTDTGIGIDKNALPYIFDKFRLVGDVFQKQSEGSGLGLSIVKALVEKHEGNIYAESSPGIGTTIAFTISKHLHASGDQPKQGYNNSIQETFINMEFSTLSEV